MWSARELRAASLEVQAAILTLDNWVADGAPPPAGPRLATTGAPTARSCSTRMGTRRAAFAARTSTCRSRRSAARVSRRATSFCSLFGTDTPFTPEKLATLYPSHGAFVSAWNQSVDDGVAGGFLVAEDAPVLKLLG